MTIATAIERASAAGSGAVGSAEMIAWLSELDGQIFEELIASHEGALTESFEPYMAADMDKQLLMSDPYSKMYVSFLLAGMDFYNAEYARYNNTQKRFETDYREAADWYNKTHMPVKAAGITFGETDLPDTEDVLPPELEG